MPQIRGLKFLSCAAIYGKPEDIEVVTPAHQFISRFPNGGRELSGPEHGIGLCWGVLHHFLSILVVGWPHVVCPDLSLSIDCVVTQLSQEHLPQPRIEGRPKRLNFVGYIFFHDSTMALLHLVEYAEGILPMLGQSRSFVFGLRGGSCSGSFLQVSHLWDGYWTGQGNPFVFLDWSDRILGPIVLRHRGRPSLSMSDNAEFSRLNYFSQESAV